jgi:hypothetical protein
MPRRVVGTIAAMNGLLLLYLLARLTDSAVSTMGKELIALDALAIGVMLFTLVRGLRAGQTHQGTALSSPAH